MIITRERITTVAGEQREIIDENRNESKGNGGSKVSYGAASYGAGDQEEGTRVRMTSEAGDSHGYCHINTLRVDEWKLQQLVGLSHL